MWSESLSFAKSIVYALTEDNVAELLAGKWNKTTVYLHELNREKVR